MSLRLNHRLRLRKLNTMNAQQLKDKFQLYLNVGKIKKVIEKYSIPDDANIVVERVEDKYFTERGGWDTLDVECPVEGVSQFHPAWCASYSEKDNILFINMFY